MAQVDARTIRSIDLPVQFERISGHSVLVRLLAYQRAERRELDLGGLHVE